MTTAAWWPWLALLLLGASHGLNPGMGWLFAVALGLQEGRARAVWQALGPLALGHAAAVGLALALMALAGATIPQVLLDWGIPLLLVGLGLRRLAVHRHPRFGGMRVGPGRLTLWSAIMATVHGAGLMVLPVARAAESHAGHHGAPVRMAGLVPDAAAEAIAATLAHSAGYLCVTGLLALVVYHRLGLRLLRTAWINVDFVWALVLVVTGVAAAIWR